MWGTALWVLGGKEIYWGTKKKNKEPRTIPQTIRGTGGGDVSADGRGPRYLK